MARKTLSFASLLSVLSLVAPGCTVVSDFGRFHAADSDAAGTDGSISDAGPPDDGARRIDAPGFDGGGADAGTCSVECTAGLSCCGGSSCFDLESDLDHCGACDTACPLREHASRVCNGTAAGCDFVCETGFADCNGRADDGCEANLGQPATCGSCGLQCAAGELCDSVRGVCAPSCSGGLQECSSSCVDTTSDLSHCGACGRACPSLPNTTRSCSASSCQYACMGAYADCDGDLASPTSNGCERIPTLYYPDDDRDGYGTGTGVAMCAAPGATFASRGGDCDDMASARNPGVTELCNGIDDDCDSVVDDGVSYMGIGVGGSCSCESGSAAGTVTCAAGAAQCAFPAEVCNGLDDDCDGSPDETFACVAGTRSSCTIAVGACTAVGTRTCSSSCTMGVCTMLAETCDGIDQDCDGFVDEGTLGLGAPVIGFGSPPKRFVAAAWRDATNGGAALLMQEADAATSRPRVLSLRTFGPGGAPAGADVAIVSSPASEVAASRGVAALADLGWDGTQWVVFYVFRTPSGSEVRRVTVTPSGALGAAVTERAGVTSVAVAMGAAGQLGVVMGDPTQVSGGVWSAGAWLRAPSLVFAGSALDAAQIASLGSGRYFAVAGDLLPRSLVWASFAISVTDSSHTLFSGAGTEADARAVLEASSGRVVVTYRNQSTGLPSVALIDPVTAVVVAGPSALGSVSNGPRPAAVGGEIYVAVSPDLRRVRPSDAAVFAESYDGSLYADALLATPGGPQRLLSFAYDVFEDALATRPIRCP